MLQGIEQAKDRALIENRDLQIMIVKLPSLHIHSSNLNAESLSPHLQNLPVKLPESMWTYRKSVYKIVMNYSVQYSVWCTDAQFLIVTLIILGVQSFPWTLSLIDFHCYTLQQQIQKNFIRKVTLNATVALTPKTAATQSNTLTALSVCVHIDNSPIIISVSEEQVSIVGLRLSIIGIECVCIVKCKFCNTPVCCRLFL